MLRWQVLDSIGFVDLGLCNFLKARELGFPGDAFGMGKRNGCGEILRSPPFPSVNRIAGWRGNYANLFLHGSHVE
jgi:hypothetical protein